MNYDDDRCITHSLLGRCHSNMHYNVWVILSRLTPREIVDGVHNNKNRKLYGQLIDFITGFIDLFLTNDMLNLYVALSRR